ncbi:hypothetical protein FOZ63_006835 [Perkinsus olseni]|uniref:Membrane magnesium transporter n=1 Tax=Perkinsus olseni TaxID=32597 RepID=A0A7J6SUB3_PEROL|nr:hypothetical protein FOZ63_006835 [Perkinsus olseni]KAF4752598.1 hypothetical protein FOZ62_005522 [Perkinsus olseni]
MRVLDRSLLLVGMAMLFHAAYRMNAQVEHTAVAELNTEMPASEVEEDTMGTAFVVTVALESIIGAAVAFVAVIGDFKPIRLSDQKTHMSWDSLNARPSFVLYKKDSAARQLLQDAVKKSMDSGRICQPPKA